jgi:hypothetical protein
MEQILPLVTLALSGQLQHTLCLAYIFGDTVTTFGLIIPSVLQIACRDALVIVAVNAIKCTVSGMRLLSSDPISSRLRDMGTEARD